MKRIYLLSLLLAGCVPELKVPDFTCTGYTSDDQTARNLLVGRWQLLSRDGTKSVGVSLLLEIRSSDSLLVFENGQQIGVFTWEVFKTNASDVAFRGNWPAAQDALPHPEGYVAVCEESLRLGTCIVDGPCYFYRRLSN